MLRIPQQGGDYASALLTAFRELENTDAPRVIQLPNETITVDREVLITSDYVTLQGGSETYVIGDGGFVFQGNTSLVLSDIVFQDFLVELEGPSTKTTVKDCDFLGTCLSIISTEDSPSFDLFVEGCYFKECGVGMHLEGYVDGWVSRCSWEGCDTAVEMISNVAKEDYLKNYPCVRMTYRDSRLRIPRGSVGFVAEDGSPLIMDGVRIDGSGIVARLGMCGKKFTHSLTRVWNNAGYIITPPGLWVESSCCDHLRFKHE